MSIAVADTLLEKKEKLNYYKKLLDQYDVLHKLILRKYDDEENKREAAGSNYVESEEIRSVQQICYMYQGSIDLVKEEIKALEEAIRYIPRMIAQTILGMIIIALISFFSITIWENFLKQKRNKIREKGLGGLEKSKLLAEKVKVAY